MPETKPSEHIPALFEPLHFQKTALAKIENARLREVLGETIDSITATLASNFWMLVAQKLAPSAQDAVSMQIHLSENFGSNNIFASGMSLADILFHAQNAETTNHLRNQIVVGLCCNLENSISQLSDYLGNPKPLKNYGVSSKPVLKWAGIGEFYKLKTAEISHGFSEET